MQTTSIRQKLHQFIDSIEDKRAAAIYTLFEEEIDIDIDVWRKKLIQIEREKYFRGEGRPYGWEQVKQMAVDKEKRNAI